MSKKLEFSVLRSESRFSDLSPGLQGLFNSDAAEEILRKEALETEEEIEEELVEQLLEEA